MKQTSQFDNEEMGSFSRILFLIGREIRDCEAVFKANGFSAAEASVERIKSLASNQEELDEYDHFREESAAEAMGSLGRFPSEPGFQYLTSQYLDKLRAEKGCDKFGRYPIGLPGRLATLERTDPREFRRLTDLAVADNRARIRNDASRYSPCVIGRSIDRKEDRVAVVKAAIAANGLLVPKQPSFAECRPIFSSELPDGFALIATLIRTDYFLSEALLEPLFDPRVAIVKGDPIKVLSQRFTHRSQFLDVRVGLIGLRTYLSCTTPGEIYCTASAYAIFCNWLKGRLVHHWPLEIRNESLSSLAISAD